MVKKRLAILLLAVWLCTGIADIPVVFAESFKDELSVIVDLLHMNNGLFRPEDTQSGYLGREGTQIWKNPRYVTSDYIAVEPSTDYVIQGITTRFCLYDENKMAITDTYSETEATNRAFHSGDALYVRFTMFRTEMDRMYLRPAEEAMYDTLLGEGYIHSDNPLLGKTLLTLGDSIMEGNGNSNFGIGDIIASRNSMYLYDYSKGGATIGYRHSIGEDFGNIQYQAEKAIRDGVAPDYILINGQTNDVDKTDLIGKGKVAASFNDMDFDTGTFAGGLEHIICMMKTAFPRARFVYVRVHHIGSRRLGIQDDYGSLALEICSKWGVPVADIYENGQLNTYLDTHAEYTGKSDKTHPTREGYDAFYINLIEATMKNH